MEAKVSVSFIGKRSRTTKQELLPIYLRATIDGKSIEAVIHHHVLPSQWLPSAGRVKGKSASAIEINMALDLARKQVYDYRKQSLSISGNFTVK